MQSSPFTSSNNNNTGTPSASSPANVSLSPASSTNGHPLFAQQQQQPLLRPQSTTTPSATSLNQQQTQQQETVTVMLKPRNKGVRCKIEHDNPGTCKIPNCPFSHIGENQLEVVPTSICRFFDAKACLRDNCTFFHGTEDQLMRLKERQPTTTPAQQRSESTSPSTSQRHASPSVLVSNSSTGSGGTAGSRGQYRPAEFMAVEHPVMDEQTPPFDRAATGAVTLNYVAQQRQGPPAVQQPPIVPPHPIMAHHHHHHFALPFQQHQHQQHQQPRPAFLSVPQFQLPQNNNNQHQPFFMPSMGNNDHLGKPGTQQQAMPFQILQVNHQQQQQTAPPPPFGAQQQQQQPLFQPFPFQPMMPQQQQQQQFFTLGPNGSLVPISLPSPQQQQ